MFSGYAFAPPSSNGEKYPVTVPPTFQKKKTDGGMYTIEGAFTIVVFTILIMMLLSIITVMETEAEIQSAINQTAMQLSQYSYAVGNKIDIENDETALLKSIIQDVKREAVGFATGSALCELLTKDRINEKYLRLVDGGYGGLNFAASNVLGDGRTITVIVLYKINVNTFGLFEKQLRICQKAQTAAWLPYYADELSAVSEDTAGKSSIWNETNFARGKYFVFKEKEKLAQNGVSPGQGIDIYDRDSGRVTEIFSMNVFNQYYSYNAGDLNNPEEYVPDKEQMLKQLNEYVNDFNKDIRQCGSTVTMDSGAEERLIVREKEMILVVPNEVKGHDAFETVLDNFKKSVKGSDGIDLRIIYSEDAL